MEEGIALDIREDIPSRKISFENVDKHTGFFIEINRRKKMWFISCSYNLHLQFIQNI